MTDELATGKERLSKELEEVRIRIKGHQQLVTQLESSLLKLRAKPRPFSQLALPPPEPVKLTAAEKFRLRNATAISKQALGKFIGIRVSDYKHEPQSFVVEITVTNNEGTLVGPYYGAFEKKDDGSYRVIKSQLPHIIIMSETRQNFPLENEQQLGEFVRELRLCCESYVDRKDQIKELMAVRNEEMIPTVSFDEGYLLVQLGVMLDKIGGKLSIFYQHNRILPHKFTLHLKDTNAHRTWSKSLRLLHKCKLVEALGLLTVKDSPPDTETDSLIEAVTTVTSKNSKKSRTTSADTSKSSPSRLAKTSAKHEFNFSDSSGDEANRSARMRRKRATIMSNIRRKTYWGLLSQQALQESSGSESNLDTGVPDSDAAKETSSVKKKVTVVKKNTAALTKKTKETKSRKRANENLPRDIANKIRRFSTPPSASDSELSDDEAVWKAAKSTEKPVLAPLFRKSSATKPSVGHISSSKTSEPRRTQISDKRPLLAAIFQKARRSLLDEDVPQPAPERLANTSQESTMSRKKPVESPASSDVPKTSSEITLIEDLTPPLKSSQFNQDSKISSDPSMVLHQTSDTVLSEAKSLTPRKVTILKSNSQDSESGESQGLTSLETLVRNLPSVNEKARHMKVAQVSLSRIQEEDLEKLSPQKGKASDVSVGREQSKELRMVRSSSQKKSANLDMGSDVGSKISSTMSKGGRASQVQDEDLVRRSPRKKDGGQDTKSGVGSKKGGKKTVSVVKQGGRKGRIQDDDLARGSPWKRDWVQDMEPGVGSKKDGKKTASVVEQGGRKGRIQDKDLPRRSPRKKDEGQDMEPGVGSKKDGKKTASVVEQGGRKARIQDKDLPRRSPRKKDKGQDMEPGVGSKKGGKKAVSVVKQGGRKETN